MDLAHPLRVVTPTVDADVLSVLSLADAAFTAPGVHRLIGEHSEAGIRKVLKRLSDQGIVLAERAGNAWLYQLNRQHLAALAIIAIARLDQTLMQRISDEVRLWVEPPKYVALFGSAAKGMMRPDSDIDLFVVRPADIHLEHPVWEQQVTSLEASVTCWTGNDTRVLEFGESEVQSGLATRMVVLLEIADEGIPLFGPDRFLGDPARKARWQPDRAPRRNGRDD